MRDYEKIIEEAKASVLPYESWERLPGESGAAFAAFCVYRDFGLERNVRKAVDSVEKDEAVRVKHYRMWRNWCAKFRWHERVADYDNYMERLKQAEIRKTIEEQGKVHREITGKMLRVVGKKLDLMDPADLSQGAVTEWVQTAIKAEREAAGLVGGKDGKPETKQGELNFASEFDGL